jgi:hypothetical protein
MTKPCRLVARKESTMHCSTARCTFVESTRIDDRARSRFRARLYSLLVTSRSSPREPESAKDHAQLGTDRSLRLSRASAIDVCLAKVKVQQQTKRYQHSLLPRFANCLYNGKALGSTHTTPQNIQPCPKQSQHRSASSTNYSTR